jgi:Mg-chelatase subunit ChlI
VLRSRSRDELRVCVPHGGSPQTAKTLPHAHACTRTLTCTRTRTQVELPLGATEDRICGTIDIEKALQEGIKAYEPGLLAKANRGILYVDEVRNGQHSLNPNLTGKQLMVAHQAWHTTPALKGQQGRPVCGRGKG